MEAPLIAKNVGDQFFACTAPDTADSVECSHHSVAVCILYSHFKWSQIQLTKGLLSGKCGNTITSLLLVIQYQMLQIAVHPLALCTSYLICAHGTCKVGILRIVLKVTSAKGCSVGSCTRCIPALYVYRKSVLTNAFTKLKCQILVPCSCQKLLVRISHAVYITHDQLAGDTCRAVLVTGHWLADAVNCHSLPSAKTNHFNHLVYCQTVKNCIPSLVIIILSTHGDQVDVIAGICSWHLFVRVILINIILT